MLLEDKMKYKWNRYYHMTTIMLNQELENKSNKHQQENEMSYHNNANTSQQVTKCSTNTKITKHNHRKQPRPTLQSKNLEY